MLYPDYQFPDSFCRETTKACQKAISARTSFNLVAVPGVGVTFFVKFLERRSKAKFIYINPYEMHELNSAALYEQLAKKLGINQPETASVDDIRQVLGETAKQHGGVVLLFNRFDRLQKSVGERFYDALHYLRDVDRAKVVLAFVTAEPLIETAPDARQSILHLVSRTLYFSGYVDGDMQEIVAASGGRAATQRELDLAGGHHLLLQVLMGCQDIENALSDPMVELLVKDILRGLSPQRQKLLERTATTHNDPQDAYLSGTHLAVRDKRKWRPFSVLVSEYLMRSQAGHLPVKEKRLFGLLQRNMGQVVSKQVIFDHVWSEDNGIASDWSLNALVYRLRRHPAFDAHRYAIESRKKEGYVLIDHLAD